MVYLISVLGTLAMLAGAIGVMIATTHGRGAMIIDALAGAGICADAQIVPTRREARVVRLTDYRPSRAVQPVQLRAAA